MATSNEDPKYTYYFYEFVEGDNRDGLILTKEIKAIDLPKGKFYFVNLMAAVTFKNN